MAGWRSTLVLLGVLIGLGAYIYFVESKRPPASETEARPRVLAIAPQTVEQFTIRSANGETITVTKSGRGWQITAPVTARADDAALSRMTSALSSLAIGRVVDETPSDLKPYGLAPPRVDVTVKVSGSRDAKQLLIGGKTAVGSDVYAKLGPEKKVFLISASLETVFNKGTFDLRDKAVIKLEHDAVDFLEITAAHQLVRLVRRGVDWDMKEPLETRADNGSVGELLTKLTALQMKSVTAPEATDLTKYGLDRPAVAVTVGAGSSRATLDVGTAADESTTYARDASRPLIFTIGRSLADDLKKGAGEFRRKDVFDFQTFDATRLEVTRAGQTTIYEKVTGTGGSVQDNWREVSPNARDIDASKMQTALSKLSYLRAVGFADPKKTKTGLEVPAVSVLVKYDSGRKEERVRLTKVGSSPFAARAGWPDAGRLDGDAYTRLTEALDDLKK